MLTRILILSNGHGEDTIGASLAAELHRQNPACVVYAYPTVGRGDAYARLGVPVLGPRRTLPSGGFLLHHPSLLWHDVRAGFLDMTARQLADLRGLETDALIVVGDIYALLLSSLVRTPARFFVQSLVSAQHASLRSHPLRQFMERITPAERWLIRRLVTHTYVRDAVTATWLAQRGLYNVSALGNPMVDALGGDPLTLPLTPPVVALLPGTRHHAHTSLGVMLQALGHWPEATGLVAWAGATPPDTAQQGWVWQPQEGVWQRGAQRVYLLPGRFAEVLQSADLALGTSGTANEQAAALGCPVVAFPVLPHYPAAFLTKQQHLLGDALTLSRADPSAIARALAGVWGDPVRYAAAAHAGQTRMGAAGGSRAIVADLLGRLELRANAALG